MKIHLIWAQEHDGGIGKNGRLPWHIPEDLKNFKKITLNSTIVMGRKTWDSLPFKPLPKRKNIVFSSNKIDGIDTYDNIDKCIETLSKNKIDEIFVIGGSSIYKVFYEFATHLHITLVKIKSKNIDTFFPIDHKKIEQKFVKAEEKQLDKNAIYSYWVKK
ncbi:MAG: dihydrofolate reductase [Pelagibacteraceae bacterium TMED246]|nr:MAG: dihydrofolate reductase [Pelagibacteraceae bacterium TMED246]|tara:strand:- start:73705 stop:74184 length:480 start_codon:yes stop_codon:yes gene_type:complete